MGFEKYDHGASPGRNALKSKQVSIRKTKSIGINTAATEAFFEDNDGVVLYYDPESEVMGLEPVDTPADHESAYTVSGTGSGGTIVAKAFIEEFDLVEDNTIQYPAEWNEEEQLVEVDLTSPANIVGSSSDATAKSSNADD